MLHLLIAYAYPLMAPLALIEGPMIALAAGMGAAFGSINPLIAYVIVMVGALFQDVGYYWLGRWAQSSPKVRGFITRVRLLRDTLGPLEEAWRDTLFVTLVSSKFAYGLYAPIIVTAGLAKAPFWPFLFQSLALSAVVLAGWLGAGYGLGRAYGVMAGQRYAGYIMTGIGVLGLLALVLVARHFRGQLSAGRKAGANRTGAALG